MTSGGEVKQGLEAELRKVRIALYMCAAHCQGGHSDAGWMAADTLGVPFPVTMPAMIERARGEGLNPATLWPWLTGPSFSPDYFTAAEKEAARRVLSGSTRDGAPPKSPLKATERGG